MTTQLTPEQSKSVQALVRTGAYRDDSQVIDEALSLLQRQEKLRARVNAGVQQLDQGQYRRYQPDERERLIDNVEAASRTLAVEIQRGISDLEHGRYRDYNEDELDTLITDVAKLHEHRST